MGGIGKGLHYEQVLVVVVKGCTRTSVMDGSGKGWNYEQVLVVVVKGYTMNKCRWW